MAYARALVDDLRSVLAHPETPLGEKVHEVRVTIKRLRALLRLIKRHVGAEEFHLLNTRLRAISQTFSKSRDQDVLRNLTRRFSLPLNSQRQSPNVPDLNATVEQLQSYARQIDRTRLRPKRLKSHLDKSWHKLNTMYEVCRRAQATPEQFHEWRKRAKDVLYQMEFAREKGLDIDKRKLRATKKLASTLGKAHDYEMLYRYLQKRRLTNELIQRVRRKRNFQKKKAVRCAQDLL